MTTGIRWAAVLVLLCPITALSGIKIRLRTVKAELIEQRLQGYRGDDSQREATLKHFFESAGCSGERLTEQPVKSLKQPNLICVLQGDTDAVILVGAHYDHVDRGDGVVDNWSGASLLPSLYEALNTGQRRYTLVFAAFAGEEQGLIGSQYYVKTMAPEKLSKLRAMICMDTLGLGPAEVWVSKSNKQLVAALALLAHSQQAPLSRVDVDGVGISDEEPFVSKRVPTIVIHSVTQSTLGILHTSKDNYQALKFDDYYATYRLLSGYLDYLDQTLDRNRSPVH